MQADVEHRSRKRDKDHAFTKGEVPKDLISLCLTKKRLLNHPQDINHGKNKTCEPDRCNQQPLSKGSNEYEDFPNEIIQPRKAHRGDGKKEKEGA